MKNPSSACRVKLIVYVSIKYWYALGAAFHWSPLVSTVWDMPVSQSTPIMHITKYSSTFNNISFGNKIESSSKTLNIYQVALQSFEISNNVQAKERMTRK